MSGKVFERPPGSGHWYWRIPIKDADGRYKTLWKGGYHTKREAEAAKSQAEVERNAGKPLTSQVTVREWFARWQANYVSQLEPSTQKDYGSLLANHILPAIGDKKLKDLRPADLDSFYAGLMKKGIHRTAVNVHHLLRGSFKQAVQLQVMSSNPTDAVRSPRAPKFTLELPNLEELRTLLQILEDEPMGELVRLCIFTGLREGELCRLTWRDVDLGRGALLVGEAKYGSSGTLPLTPETVTRLVRWRLAQKQKAEEMGPAWHDNDMVFPKDNGEPTPTARVRKQWGRIREKAGVSSRFHDLRHVHASLLIALGLHPKKIQERLRHKHIATTMDTYGHLMADIEDTRADMAAIDALFSANDS